MQVLARLATIAIAAAFVALPDTAIAKRAKKAPQIVPTKKTGKQRRADRKTRDFSEGGTRRGALELTLGSLVTALSLGLVGRGAWEIVKGQRLVDDCASGASADVLCETVDPSRGNKIAAGVSFGLVGPVAVAGAFLLARGVRIERDYKKFKAKNKATVSPWMNRGGGGLSFRFRF